MQSLFSIDKKKMINDGLLFKTNLVIIFLTVIILLYICSQRIFIVQTDMLSNEVSKRDFCHLVMKQMINKKLSPKLIQDSLYNLITRNDYSALYIKGVEKIVGAWSGDDMCKVLIKGQTLRSFDFYLTTSGEFPFYYQVRKITEHDLFEEEEK
jgi:hypothetical protein